MSAATAPPPALPHDAEGILALAARSMFHLFSSISQGMFLVDRGGRIVWVNEGYKPLPAGAGLLVDRPVPRPPGGGRDPQHADAPRARNRRADPDRPAHQQGRHLRRQPHSAARGARGRRGRRGHRRDRHRALRPSRNHAAAAHQQVRAAAARSRRRAARTREPAQQPALPAVGQWPAALQVHLCQLHRQQPGGGGGQAPCAARGAVFEPRAAAGRNRHRQGTARACDPCGLGARRRSSS